MQIARCSRLGFDLLLDNRTQDIAEPVIWQVAKRRRRNILLEVQQFGARFLGRAFLLEDRSFVASAILWLSLRIVRLSETENPLQFRRWNQ